MDVIKREQDFNVSLDYLSENEFFNDEKECRFYMETTLIRYISNYLSSEVVELEELMEIKQLIQRQKLERMIKVHKEMRGLDRYREQPKEYKYHDPYDDWIFRQLADIDNRNNIHATFNLGKALHIDTDFIRKFLLFHSSVFSYGLYILS